MDARLIACDLDGTLLRSDGTIGERTRAALAACRATGALVVLCTARPLRWVRPVAATLGVDLLAACNNGGVIWDLNTDVLIGMRALAPDAARRVVEVMSAAVPGGAWAVERTDGFAHEPHYRPHWPVPEGTEVASVKSLVREPAVKLLFRHGGHCADAMLDAGRGAVGPMAELTHSNSNGDLLEISAPGVSKATALAELCRARGISAQEVVAFGDMPNDVAMLRWSGHAVAVAGAHPDVIASTDEVTLSNDEEGVAHVLERMLGRRRRTSRAQPADVVLVTGSDMPTRDTESPLIIAALEEMGVKAAVWDWTQPMNWAQAALVVCRSTWDYFGRVSEFLNWIDRVDAVARLENPAALMRWNAHKSYLLELADSGVPVVPTSLVTRGAGAVERAAALEPFPQAVVKPAIGGGAMGAMRGAADQPELVEHLARLAEQGDVLVQPLIASVPLRGETSLFYFGGELSHAVRKVPREGDWRVQPQHGGSVEAHEPTAEEQGLATAVLDALGTQPLYARIDAVHGSAGPLLMEAELIEPFLFLEAAEGAVERFARAVARRL